MRTDFLEKIVERLERETQAAGRELKSDEDLRSRVLRAVLGPLGHVDWGAILKGTDMGLSVAPGSKVETYYVDSESTFDEMELGSRWTDGTNWPTKWQRAASSENPVDQQVIVRVVGRGGQYASAVEQQMQERGREMTWGKQLHELLLAGSSANTRARKVRSRRALEALGRTMGGIEVQQEWTFIARREDGLPLAVWEFGVRVFFPTGRALDGRDAVPVVRIELLKGSFGGRSAARHLDAAFRALIVKLCREAMEDIAQNLECACDPGTFDASIPLALQVTLLPGMDEQVQAVHDDLIALFDEDGASKLLFEPDARVYWIDVVVPKRPVAEAEQLVQAKKDQRQQDLDAARSALQPGDQFALIIVDVREYVRGRSARFFPATVEDERDDFLLDYGHTPEDALREADLEDLVSDLAAEQHVVNLRLREAAGLEPGEQPDSVYRELSAALDVALAGETSSVENMHLFVLMDIATGAQAVHLTMLSEKPGELVEFLNRSTSIPAKGFAKKLRPIKLEAQYEDPDDPGGLTLLVRPKSLLVPKSLASRWPEIAGWCSACGTAILHPEKGLGILGSMARLWREELRRTILEDESRVGMRFADLARALKETCWVLNEIPAEGPANLEAYIATGHYSGQRGADTSRFRRWRRELIAAAEIDQ